MNKYIVTELRIGNILKDGAKVLALSDDNIRIVEISGFEYDSICNMPAHGEPLTSEWLERFGFEEYHSNPRLERFYVLKTGYYPFQVYVERDFSIYYTENVRLEHVHQLQNLYFALTGQELELK